MHEIGAMLRAARVRWGLTLREVHERSQALAQKYGRPAYSVSMSWLDRVERENRSISATKLIVLASIYQLTADQMLLLCPEPAESGLTLLEKRGPNSSLLFSEGQTMDEQARLLLEDVFTGEVPTETSLLQTAHGLLPADYRRGIIGLRDRTLEPMVQPGAVVLIDTTKTRIVDRSSWTTEFNRPIYFLLTREGYLAGFCDLDKKMEWLTLVPHLLSRESYRRWLYKQEVDIIGTVTAVLSRRAA